MIKDITNDIDIYIRETKDVEYKCPKCKEKQTICNVNLGEYTNTKCYKCGYEVKFFVNDFW